MNYLQKLDIMHKVIQNIFSRHFLKDQPILDDSVALIIFLLIVFKSNIGHFRSTHSQRYHIKRFHALSPESEVTGSTYLGL